MFSSEVATFESSEKKEEEIEQPQEEKPFPADAQQVLNILGNGSLEQFVSAYIQLLQHNSQSLVNFLNEIFQCQEKNIFEFLFNAHKANSNKEWSVKTFFVTIMNIGLTLKDQAHPTVYYYLLLTNESQPSPIYGLVPQLEPTKELNEHFNNIWNSMFGIQKQVKKEGFVGNINKNSRITIIFTIIALFVVLMMSAGYFFNKYGNSVSVPNLPIKPVPVQPSITF